MCVRARGRVSGAAAKVHFYESHRCNDEVVTGGSSDTLGSPKGTFSLQAVSERYDTGLRPSES